MEIHGERLVKLGKAALFLGLLLSLLEYVPWGLIPPYVKAFILIGLGIGLVIVSSSRKAGVKGVLTLLLASLATSILLASGPVYAANSLGFRLYEPAPNVKATLDSFSCNGSLFMNISIPFNVSIIRKTGGNVTVELDAPANLLREVKESLQLKGWAGNFPNSLEVYSEYKAPLILKGLRLVKPKLELIVRVPDGCQPRMLMLNTVNGNVYIDIDAGLAQIRTNSGNVTVKGTYLDLSAMSVTGDLNYDVTIKGSGSGDTVNGDILGRIKASYGYYTGGGIRGFTASSNNGNISLELLKDDNIYLNVTAQTEGSDIVFKGIRVLSKSYSLNVTGVHDREVEGVVGSRLLKEFRVDAYSKTGTIVLRYSES